MLFFSEQMNCQERLEKSPEELFSSRLIGDLPTPLPATLTRIPLLSFIVTLKPLLGPLNTKFVSVPALEFSESFFSFAMVRGIRRMIYIFQEYIE